MTVLRVAAVAILVVATVSPVYAQSVTCDGKEATIVGTAGDDVLTGTDGDDVIAGLNGDDTINGMGGNDTICGNGGDDVIDGGAGDDFIKGGDDNGRGPDNHGDVISFVSSPNGVTVDHGRRYSSRTRCRRLQVHGISERVAS